MPPPTKKKIDLIYDALSVDPKYAGVGTREQFTKAMSDSATARKVHDALSVDKKYAGIGTFDQFYTALNAKETPIATPVTPPATNPQPIPVTAPKEAPIEQTTTIMGVPNQTPQAASSGHPEPRWS